VLLPSLLSLRSSGFSTGSSKYFRAVLLDAATLSFAAKAVLCYRFERDDPPEDEREGQPQEGSPYLKPGLLAEEGQV